MEDKYDNLGSRIAVLEGAYKRAEEDRKELKEDVKHVQEAVSALDKRFSEFINQLQGGQKVILGLWFFAGAGITWLVTKFVTIVPVR